MRVVQALPWLVARIPVTIHAKLLAAFLAIAALLVAMGVVSLQVLGESNRRAQDLVMLQNKLAAYHQLQYDATEQLYNVTSALLVPDDQTLDAALRQMRQFGYDYARLQFVAQDEAELLAQVEGDYTEFTQLVTQVTDLIHAGKVDDARALESGQARPLADRLERRTNQLVNKAEGEMLARTEENGKAYVTSQRVVMAFAAGAIALALLLGYAISWSVIGPVRRMDGRLREIAAGSLAGQVEVPNRDELGTLAANLNWMNAEIAAQSDQLAEWNRTLEQRVQQQVEEIQRARERLVTAREEERRRLRRDLHDGLGPTLASLFQRLDTTLALVSRDSDAAVTLLLDLKSQVRTVIADVRRLVYGLRPPTLDEFGLLGALREHAVRLSEANGLRLTVQAPDSLPPLPAAVEVAAYRIALEGLTNVTRHAQASECCVNLSLSDALYLEIADNGVGIRPASHPGVGITSMRERAVELGGELRIEAGSVGGTRIRARLPLSQVQE
jgi:signal transduction histidine kinase